MSWRSRVETARRDVAWIARRLVNRRPAPFTLTRSETATRPHGDGLRAAPRAPHDARASSAGGAEAVLAPRILLVREVVRETADAVSLVLEDPAGAPIAFRPGQFLTLLVDVDGQTHRRPYSIASAATDPSRVVVGVKRVEGGRVSAHLTTSVRAGDALRVLGPSGSFGARAEGTRHLVLVGGGSGVTPLMSILRTALAREAETRVTLVYANRGPEHVLFAAALEALAAAEPSRFHLRHVFGDTAGATELAAALEGAGAFGDGTEYYLCGPPPMMDAARRAILGSGVDGVRVHEERFTAAPRAAARLRAAGPARVTFRVHGLAREVDVAPGQTLLEAGLTAGVPMPFSCAMGGCGSCKVHVVSGAVEMDEPNCLTPAERGAGQVLACLSRATGEPLTVEVEP